MRRRRIAVAGVALAAAGGLAATLAVLPAAAEEDEQSAVAWGACPEDVPGAERMECATVPVPLDYDAPDGDAIDVMISRLASTNPEERRGALLLNPGGPGGAGLGQPVEMADLGLPDSVTDAYDLIGMDPRGVGHSTPVSCGFTEGGAYRGNVPPYAADDAAVDAQAEIAEAVADQCAAADTEGLLPHISTANTARDIDAVRAALGEDELSYYGASYGSTLGAAYASLFPDTSGRVVLDSNTGGTAFDYEDQRRWGSDFGPNFQHFAEWAAERDDGYGLGGTPEAVRETFFALAEQLDEQPVAEYDGAMFRFVVFVSLYSEGSFPGAARLWQSLAAGDAAAASRLGGELDVPASTKDGSDGAVLAYDNAWSAYLAVTCNDSDWPEDLAVYRENAAADREAYPMFGGAGANVMPCAFWSDEPAEPEVPITDEGPQNVLIVQNLLDVATPYAGAEINREAFGDRSRLVSVDGFGHGVYVYGGNACALNTATAFLVDGEMPESDVRCEA
ncbi:alpha/beta hydrolase [Glycomyces harbinensis]|uniref:Alpha/beta hydrolase fold n=1 Tax=Glycomyces harbinensis TaxID=58114 RepID=A0A1G6XA79_9ACTN|nr:alpha/beta hydrolase [Glycomyces harbinensis]SDD75008.1 alpha/beta hydrolase fold [Glycomyces harbinensis]